MIELKNVSKTYATGEEALCNVSLAVKKGEIFGIVGKSGAGKSTMLKLMGLLEQPSQGQILIAGEDATCLKSAKANAVRRHIGTVFQGYNLLMQRNVARNIAFPLELLRKDKKLIKERCAELTELVGLADKLKAYPAKLSGGQKQRVAIARSLATSPKILLCDEPTSALDSFTSKEILRLIKDINIKLGMTIVIITHDIHVIRAICHRTAVMDGGRIVELGETREVLDNPKNPETKLLLDFDV